MKQKWKEKSIKEESTRQVITVEPEENPPCKKCKKEPRRNSSAFCGKCADNYKKEQSI